MWDDVCLEICTLGWMRDLALHWENPAVREGIGEDRWRSRVFVSGRLARLEGTQNLILVR